eukprot:6209639-Alexandrium_andersonii.AAC.1
MATCLSRAPFPNCGRVVPTWSVKMSMPDCAKDASATQARAMGPKRQLPPERQERTAARGH